MTALDPGHHFTIVEIVILGFIGLNMILAGAFVVQRSLKRMAASARTES